MDLIGQAIGDYELLLLLGQGSSAHVYLGRHKHNRSYVAVKILNAQVIHERIEVWNNEGHMLSLINHPHIIRMYDFGVQDGMPFRITHWAVRGTLHDLFAQPTSIQGVTAYVKQVASALQYLHTMHIIHRDIKPTNILVEPAGHVWLADFEFAVDYRECKSTMGTPVYAAPEQKHGRPCPASDQYALGTIVYQWLCGALPFSGTPAEILAQQENVPPPSLQGKSSLLPEAVDHVILTALSQDPNSRFTNVQTFAEALEQACHFSSYCTPPQNAGFYYTESGGGKPPDTSNN